MKRFQLFVRGISTNWTGTLGVVFTTSAFLLFIFFELLRVAGILTNSYVGLISYMALPALFLLGLILVPLGWWQFRRATGQSTEELLSKRFPDEMIQTKRLGSSLVGMIALLTVVNVLFIGLGGARMLHFMDEPEFCGTACHQVMEPEWVAYQNSPHAHVRCIDCHVGEGADALINAKLNGLWQVVSATFDLYERPIPTPVHQLRPARETCQKCHWPDKFYGDRIKVIPKFAQDEASTPSFTTLSLKVGSGTGLDTGTIHWHIAKQNEVRYQAADAQRMNMQWVEVRKGETFHRYTNSKLEPVVVVDEAEPMEEVRSMDCVDCHNRATHIYLDPESAIDAALADGRISRELPFAKKVALAALGGNYGQTKAEGLRGVENSVRGTYLRSDGPGRMMLSEIDHMVTALQGIYEKNIFPRMNVQWNTYPSHLGHSGTAGCFRCHNEHMVDDAGQSIAYDCTLCHSILAQDSAEQFQFLLPLNAKDPDLMMHKYLKEEFLGVPQAMPESVEVETEADVSP